MKPVKSHFQEVVAKRKTPFLFLQEMGFHFFSTPIGYLWVKGLWIRSSGISQEIITEWEKLSRGGSKAETLPLCLGGLLCRPPKEAGRL
jgi:hypothetical protein